MPTTPDEAQQQDGAPRQRATATTARQIAENISAQLSDLRDVVTRLDKVVYDHVKQYQDEHIREKVTTHANSITDLRDELHGFQNGITRQLEKIREQLDNRTEPQAEATQTIVDRTATKLTELLARTEALERRTADTEALASTAAERAAAPTGGDGHATQLQARVAKLEEMLNEAVKSVAHLPGPDELLTRLSAVERRLSTVGAIRDGEAQPVGGVHAKVLELMRRVNVIGKDRQADQGTGGRFMFRGIDEAMDAVGHAMREVGLTMRTTLRAKDYSHNTVTKTYTDRGQERTSTVLWTTATVTYRYTFVDPVDGSEHAFEMAGEGRDASDKATSKAGSMALKYGLLQALMVPVKGMDDGDTESPQVSQDDSASQRRAAAQPPAQQQKPAKSKGERAQDAVTAVRNINRWPAEQRLDKLIAISSLVESEGLGNIEVDGATVRAHIVATERTLAPAPEPPADEKPF